MKLYVSAGDVSTVRLERFGEILLDNNLSTADSVEPSSETCNYKQICINYLD